MWRTLVKHTKHSLETWSLTVAKRQFKLLAGPLRCNEGGDSKASVNIVFVDKDGKKTPVQAQVGSSLLFIAQKNGIPMEGACDSSLACSTCHVYVDVKVLDLLSEPDKKEEDMLDMAPFLKANSRLGCQVIVQPEMEGMEVGLPPATRNFYIDGKVPDPH